MQARKKPIEVLSTSEIRSLLRATGRGPTSARDRAALVLMWRAGLRVSEMLGLRVVDYDPDGGVVRVQRGKAGTQRVVGIDPSSILIIDAWIEAREKWNPGPGWLLFCTRDGRPVNRNNIGRTLSILKRRAGLEKRIHPHALRHTFTVELARENVPIDIIQRALGHASCHTTSGYLHEMHPGETIDALQRRSW